MKPKRQTTRCSECPKRCCLCGSTEDLQQNHVGGWRWVIWFFLPYCAKVDHKAFHARCRMAGVDFSYTGDRAIELIQALKAILVGMWMVVEMLEAYLNEKNGKGPDNDRKA